MPDMTKDEAEEILTGAVAAYLENNPEVPATKVFRALWSSNFQQGDQVGTAANTVMQLHLARVVTWIAHGVLEARKRKG